jgi:hypothetical protein
VLHYRFMTVKLLLVHLRLCNIAGPKHGSCSPLHLLLVSYFCNNCSINRVIALSHFITLRCPVPFPLFWYGGGQRMSAYPARWYEMHYTCFQKLGRTAQVHGTKIYHRFQTNLPTGTGLNKNQAKIHRRYAGQHCFIQPALVLSETRP